MVVWDFSICFYPHLIPYGNISVCSLTNTAWNMLIPLRSTRYSVLLTQMPMNSFCNVIMPNLVLLSCQSWTASDYMHCCLKVFT